MDASQEEEACSSLRVSMSVDKEGHVTSSNKEGGGGIPYHKMNDLITVSDSCTFSSCKLFHRLWYGGNNN